jgi:hypothetical protein
MSHDLSTPDVRRALSGLLAELEPGARLTRVAAFGIDEGSEDSATSKGFGYGKPLLVEAQHSDDTSRSFVFHTASPDVFGHDRRSDRAQAMLLAFDTFASIPRHSRAIDVGAICQGQLRSLRDSGEFYLLSEFVPGRVYADDLRAIARRGAALETDRERVLQLADLLVEIHAEKHEAPLVYRRAARDLVGSGEGIFGIVDGFPAECEVPTARLGAIDALATSWRPKLKQHCARLSRVHADFHPFNILVDEAEQLRLLDTSRGSLGEPADDVSCLAINFIFFSLGHDGAWGGAFKQLWHMFWERYLTRSGDSQLLDVVGPFIAWRGLVLANPAWYPGLAVEHRDALLCLVERALSAPRFDVAWAEELFG